MRGRLIPIFDKKRFRLVNEERFNKFKTHLESDVRRERRQSDVFNRTSVRRFFKNNLTLTPNEVQNLIYQVLREHPEGLTFRQIQAFSGLGRITLKKGIALLKSKLLRGHRGIYVRIVDTRTILYYAEINARKLSKQIIKTNEELKELERKLEQIK